MRRPPRLVARTVAVTFGTVAVVLTVVFVALAVEARERVRSAELGKLQVSGRLFTALEARRQRDQQATISTLAENSTLKSILDTYFAESQFGGLEADRETALRATVEREALKLASAQAADVVAVLDTSHRVFASVGVSHDAWSRNQDVQIANDTHQASFQGVAVLPAGAYRVAGATLRIDDPAFGTLVRGTLLLATSLDTQYAQQLAELSGAGVVITVNDRVVARTVPAQVTDDLVAGQGASEETRTLAGEEYAIRTLLASGTVRIFTLTSIDAAARAATSQALRTLALIAAGSFLLAALASVWLARTVTDPINRLAHGIAGMTQARTFDRRLDRTGTSRELDELADAFNEMMRGLTVAEADSRAAYLGAIRALAAALDARDPYTAGHSERVSTISVLMARELVLDDASVDIVRLGAVLHDIGKIGLADEVLRKPGALTALEFEQVKRHPALGARILRQVPFLAPHVPIVELHHERPDGGGYPFGLRNDDIPLAARIVHVADAFDAMTSARAYRPAREVSVALAELQRFKGTQFDAVCVDALAAALPLIVRHAVQADETELAANGV